MVVLFGALVGLSLGLTGGGGSILAVPLLIYGVGLDAKAAVSTSLAAVALIAAVGTGDAARRRLLEIRVALIFAATAVLAAPAGVAMGETVSDVVIVLAFALLTMVVGISMLWRARQRPHEAGVVRAGLTSLAGHTEAGPTCRYSEDGVLRLTAPCSVVLAMAGLAVGLLSGFFGVGGGFLIVPTLLLVTQIGIQRAVATSLLIITLTGISGVTAAYVLGREVPWFTTGLFVLGGIAGMGLGRRFAACLAGPALQQLFAVAIVLMGAGMLALSQV